MRIRSLPLFAAMLMSYACGGPRDSDLMHVLGETRKAPAQALENCQTDARFKTPSNAAAYLRDIARQIMVANPSTFSGEYAFENFCFAVAETPAVNAYALPNNRGVVFNTGIFKIFQNDADVAAILSHELAHVTRQHTNAPHEKLAANATWQNLNRQLSPLVAKEDTLYDGIRVLQEESDRRENALDETASDEIRKKRETLMYRQSQLMQAVAVTAGALTDDEESSAFFELNDGVLPAVPRAIYTKELAATNQKLSTATQAKWATLLKDIQAFNQEVTAVNQAEAQANATRWAPFQAAQDKLNAKMLELYPLQKQITDVRGQLDRAASQILGEARFNWAEEEADDVGLELYLRSGFMPVYYSGMFEKLAINEPDQVNTIAQCRTDVAMRKLVPARGAGTHPASCWRVYNALIQEMDDHKSAYDALIEKAKTVDLFKDRLKSIKQSMP